MLQADNLCLHKGRNKILDNISLTISQGEMLGLIGPNGAGKTSLLKILAGIQHADSGIYTLHQQPINIFTPKMLAREFGYLAQDATAHWPLRVKSLIALGRLPFQGISNRLSPADEEAIEEAARQTEVTHLLERTIDQLSGGERTRVFLARLLASQPRVIFVDEPVAALDPYHQLHVMEILHAHAANGGSVVIVLHDLNLAARYCDRLALMDKGRIIAEGRIDTLLQGNLLQETYGVQLRMFCQDDAYALTPWQRITDSHT